MKLYPALTQSNFENPSNFKNYTKSAKARHVIVDEQNNIRQGSTYWGEAFFDGFVLPAQGKSKPYCKKWISWGCDNVKQHPKRKHYAEHEQKTCKTSHCPKCFESWINRQANRSTRRFSKFLENKKYNFRHIVLSPPQERAKIMNYEGLKNWLNSVLKIANIKTCAVVFHPFRFQDREKIQPYVSPHFHLLVYGKVTNTMEFYNKTKWLIKNKGGMKTDVDIFNCVRYLLSHAGVRKKTHVIRYLGDISYRKLKVQKEPQNHHCPYCSLPLTIFYIKSSKKSLKPPIDYVGLWEKSNFIPFYPNEDSRKEEGVPFYELKKDAKDERDYIEEKIYSFEELLSVKTNLPKIIHRKYELNQSKFVSSFDCKKLEDFIQTP
ncbi:hypothetical protein [Nitrosopumilus ureiphilus]|uniref:Replication protein n=1 Tax=Nitrosopumilus ureiphilus TaxID=1470067 RepID=A0A7D5RAL9_9ARCH|nr:hypothetical protein [Nitrosopumilus ureiphilus]QLH06584.1 hypothetical protein C5F50_05505 [Nitrosopumilus ureiphilus]